MSAEPTSKSAVVLKAVNKPTEEIGAPGLKEYGGFLQEEFVVDLRGQRGVQRYKEMVDNCPAVDAALSTMKNTAQRSIQDGRVEPFGDDKAKAEDEERAEFVEQCFEDMEHSRSDMDDEAFTMFEIGHAPLEIVYKRRNGFKRDAERSSRFDDEAVGWSKVKLRAQESVLKWEFDEMGRRLLGMIQIPAPSYQQLTIPIDRIALFRTTSIKGNPEGRSLLRAAYFAYKFFKRGTAMGWVGAERDVTGIPVLKGPATLFSATPSTDQATGLARLKQIGENVRNDEQACVLIPSDVDPETKVPLYSFDLVSSPGTKVMDVPAMTRDQERQILMVLFSDFLLMGHEKIGTQAMFGGRIGLYAMQLDSLLDRYDETINRQMIPRLAMLNGWPMDRLPQFRHGRVTETALEELGKFLQAYATAGGVLDPDLDAYVREQAGWPQQSPEMIEVMTEGILNPPQPPMPGKNNGETEPEADEVEEGEDEDEKPKVEKAAKVRQRQGRFAHASGDVISALGLLRDRQRVGGGDSISHGLEVATEYPFLESKDYKSDIEAADVREVELSSVRATQASVRRERVRDFVENPRVVPPGKRSLSGVLEDLPVVFETGDGMFLQDGHHRMAAAKLLGQKTAKARVVRA